MNKAQKKSDLSKEDVVMLLGGKFTWKLGDIQKLEEDAEKENGDVDGSQSNR